MDTITQKHMELQTYLVKSGLHNHLRNYSIYSDEENKRLEVIFKVAKLVFRLPLTAKESTHKCVERIKKAAVCLGVYKKRATESEQAEGLDVANLN